MRPLIKIFIFPFLLVLLLSLIVLIPSLQFEVGKLKLLLLLVLIFSIINIMIRILVLMVKRKFNPMIISSVVSIAVAYLGVFGINFTEQEMEKNISDSAKKFHKTCRQQGQCSSLEGLEIPLCEFEKEIPKGILQICRVYGIKFSPSLVLENKETFIFSYPIFSEPLFL